MGDTEDRAFTVVDFNTSVDKRMSGGEALHYAYPHGSNKENQSIPVKTSKATPGSVESWQVPENSIPFQGYPNYPDDDGMDPTLRVCQGEGLPVPQSIQEGEWLKVMYEVDLLKGGIPEDRLEHFENGERSQLSAKLSIYKRGVEKTSVSGWDRDSLQAGSGDPVDKHQTNKETRLGHFLMQIPADILFGHDQVTFKVRAYTLYGMSETEENTVKINRLNDTAGEVRLNVQDGTLLSGTSTITENNGSTNEDTAIELNREPVQHQRMLEDGAYFMIKTAGMDSYYKNAVTAPYGENPRDILTILTTWSELPLSRAIHVDNKYFTYNTETKTYDVTLTVWAGSSGTPFEEIYEVVADENHEDFKVSGLELKLANGKSYRPTSITPENDKTNTDTGLDTWHQIGDSEGMVPYLNATFQIPASEVNAVGYAVDTTKLTDGTHEIRATSGEKETVAEVIVDNTAPDIELGVVQGSVVYQPFTLEAGSLATDANGIRDLAVSLNGQPLALPATVVPHDLAVGTYTIRVAASDMAGNISSAEVEFETQEVDPQVSDTDHDGITPTTANISVSLDGE